MPNFYKEFFIFRKSKKNQQSSFSLDFADIYPCLNDNSSGHSFDAHYIYHPAWASRIVTKIKPRLLTDIGSTLHFSTVISSVIKTKYYDIRKLKLNLSNLSTGEADLVNLPFKSNSIECLSCMHTIEHIGLGRYGDTIDFEGDEKAIKEISRVIQKGGHLLFVVPIGKKAKIMFNAHRIYTYDLVMSYFPDFKLRDFSLITDTPSVEFISPAKKKDSNKQNYGCGCFWLEKKQ